MEATMQVLVGFLVGYLLASLAIALVGGIELINLSKNERIPKNAYFRFALFSIFWLPMLMYLIYQDWRRS